MLLRNVTQAFQRGQLHLAGELAPLAHAKFFAAVEYGAALGLALANNARGEQTTIAKLADDLAKRFPDDTLVRFNYLPTLRAQIALNRDQPSQAIVVLQA